MLNMVLAYEGVFVYHQSRFALGTLTVHEARETVDEAFADKFGGGEADEESKEMVEEVAVKRGKGCVVVDDIDEVFAKLVL